MRKYNHGKFNRRTTLTALGVGAISTFTIPPISTPRTESRSASNSDTAQGTGDRGTNDPPPEHENVAWAHIYGSSEDDDARGVVQAHGDGYVFTGHRNNSLWIVHVDSEGQTVWERTYRGEGGHDIIRTPDKGYVIVGTTGDGPLLSKVDAAGSVVWSHSLDTGSLAQAVERADEGEYILGGSIIDDDGWIANVDATGNVMWSRTFGGQKYDDFRSLATADKGGIIATGLTQSGAPDQAPWVVKVDSDGNHD